MQWQPIETIPQEKAVDVWIVSEGNPDYGMQVIIDHAASLGADLWEFIKSRA